MLCSKLHCQKSFRLKHISYEIVHQVDLEIPGPTLIWPKDWPEDSVYICKVRTQKLRISTRNPKLETRNSDAKSETRNPKSRPESRISKRFGGVQLH